MGEYLTMENLYLIGALVGVVASVWSLIMKILADIKSKNYKALVADFTQLTHDVKAGSVVPYDVKKVMTEKTAGTPKAALLNDVLAEQGELAKSKEAEA